MLLAGIAILATGVLLTGVALLGSWAGGRLQEMLNADGRKHRRQRRSARYLERSGRRAERKLLRCYPDEPVGELRELRPYDEYDHRLSQNPMIFDPPPSVHIDMIWALRVQQGKEIPAAPAELIRRSRGNRLVLRALQSREEHRAEATAAAAVFYTALGHPEHPYVPAEHMRAAVCYRRGLSNWTTRAVLYGLHTNIETDVQAVLSLLDPDVQEVYSVLASEWEGSPEEAILASRYTLPEKVT